MGGGPTVLVTLALREEAVRRIEAVSPDVRVDYRPTLDRAALDTLADPTLEAIVGEYAPRDRRSVPRLRWLQLGSAGVDHHLADPPWRDGLVVTNARGAYAVPIAEYVLGAVLGINLPIDSWTVDQAARRWPAYDALPVGRILRDQVAVLVGYGSIGREVARLLAAAGVRIVAVKARPENLRDTAWRVPGTGDPDGLIPERIVPPEGLAEVAGEADYLVLTAPLTSRSRGIVDERVLARLRPSAWLINVSRGALVDDGALFDALRSGRLGGAVLDAFREEPLSPDSPFWDAPNVRVTPHVSGSSWTYLTDLVLENLRRYLGGEPLLNVVDPVREY